MPIIPLRPLLEATDRYGFAHGAFNVNTAAQAQAVIEIHETFRSAAILQGADLANAFMGGRADFMNGTVEDKRLGARVPIALMMGTARATAVSIRLSLQETRSMASTM